MFAITFRGTVWSSISEQRTLPWRTTPSFVFLNMMVYGLEYPFVLAPAFLPPSAYPLWGQSEKQRRPSCYAALFRNSLSSDVSSIVLVTNLKHSTIWADRKEVNSIPARPRATYLVSNWLWWSCEFCVLRQLIQASLQQQCSCALSGLCS